MKKNALLTVVATLFALCSFAQNYVTVNSEKVFKSIEAYNAAIKQLDDLAAQYQANIDKAYTATEQMYNNYQAQKGYLSETQRKTRETEIINREKEITQYQEEVLGTEGDLIKKRIELIKPIQEKVFAMINSYATQNNYCMVIDVVNNQYLLFSSPAVDKTDEIINLLK